MLTRDRYQLDSVQRVQLVVVACVWLGNASDASMCQFSCQLPGNSADSGKSKLRCIPINISSGECDFNLIKLVI